MKLLGVKEKTDHFELNFSGTICRFHYLWLRDNCPNCRSPNGQKLHETNQLDPRIRPKSVSSTDSELVVRWDDGTESVFDAAFLLQHNYDTPLERSDRAQLWTRTTRGQVQRHDYDAVKMDAVARTAWLSDVAVYGFSLLRNVPAVEEKLFDVVTLFGFVRVTNYGRLFEVRTEENPSNLAFTPQPLSLHTDNPYRDPCPTLQILHCLQQSDEGGLTALSDGFYAATKLKEEAPNAFALLAECEAPFYYESTSASLHSTQKVIAVNSNGDVEKIHINNRSMAPLSLPFDTTAAFYDALFKFRHILESEESQYTYALESGDLLLLDNERVLHGRVGHSVGKRHLQGCYADRDGLLSTLRLLEAEAMRV